MRTSAQPDVVVKNLGDKENAKKYVGNTGFGLQYV